MFCSCANRVTPSGGDKDVLPPIAKRYAPLNYSTRFTDRKIVIDFDEYIQLKDINKQLIISPLIEPEPEISIHKRSLVIELPDSLKPNTTYTINFGEAVADVHEGNSLTGFQYVFSTGEILDSLQCSGKVMDAFSHKTEKGIVVMLYRGQDDSLPFKKLPDYFAKTDETGNYTIKNISAGTYKIFALNDKNNNYRCDNPQEEAIAFADSVIIVPGTQPATLKLFTQAPGTLFVKRAIKEPNGAVIIAFNKTVQNLAWNITVPPIAPDGILSEVSQQKDSLWLWLKDTTADTLKLTVSQNAIVFDTISVSLKRNQSNSGRGKGEQRSSNTFTYRSNIINGELKPQDTLRLIMSNPIISSMTSGIKLLQDSIPVIDFNVYFNDLLKRELIVYNKWKDNVKYNLVIPAGSFNTINGMANDTIQLNFFTMSENSLGTLKTSLAIANDSVQRVLQLVNENLQIIQQVNVGNPGIYIFENIAPGSYKLRLLDDKNSNGKWDGGDYWSKKLPENFRYYTDPIQVRANWELEVAF